MHFFSYPFFILPLAIMLILLIVAIQSIPPFRPLSDCRLKDCDNHKKRFFFGAKYDIINLLKRKG